MVALLPLRDADALLKIAFNNGKSSAMKTAYLLALSFAGMLACTTKTVVAPPAPGAPVEEAPVEEETETPAEEATAEPFEQFGAKLGKRDEVDFTALLESPVAYKGKTVITSGVVRQNCNKRGCWMDVRPETDRAALSLTVRFKNYGFFVPLNSRGARVRMEGIVKVTEMTAEEVLHMEEEGATVTGKKADGSAEVVEFTAAGVEMRGRKK